MRPDIGVGVFIFNSKGQFIVGVRKGSHGAGTLALPGGHLEFGETFEACAEREVLEETGLNVRDLRFLTATNSVMKDVGKHYVTIFMGAVVDDDAQPQLVEPEKCEGWSWATWGDIKSQSQSDGKPRLFLPLLELLRNRSLFDPKEQFARA
ncbi:nucleotide triphosphate diphosphatase NUDT15 [Aspergillus ruber CBS 135680]|uniref:Nudix hydrolase domain-containing protein n=1 Tax=Aspergillus ruber (strain CBS 135680) TaxID=1388766 RepID=A0A017S5F8_ASPRC|nr:uncharacterized protein EURHEDRAFT_517868 [Aspergillus ruber CBS 135680]EYE92036.1 hypothetical protein EURHEDRAFT_517868 [Aspergillus ruber CBS 135680]